MQFFQILNWLLCRVLLLTSQLDKNHISCIEEGAFRALRSLEVLWVSWWVQMKSRSSYIECGMTLIWVSLFPARWTTTTLAAFLSPVSTTCRSSAPCEFQPIALRYPECKTVHMGNRKEMWKTADRFLLIISLLSRSFFLCSWMFSFFVALSLFSLHFFSLLLLPFLLSFIHPSLPLFFHIFPSLYSTSFPVTPLLRPSFTHTCAITLHNVLILFTSSSSSHLLCPSLRLPPPSRLHSNSLRCDCHLAWLSPWLRQRAALGLYTQCSSPPSLRGLNLAELRKSDFACSGTAAQWHDTPVDDGVDIWTLFLPSYSIFSSLGHSGSAFVQPCSLASGSCPPMCSCSNNIVDCRGRGLTAIPAHLPEAMTEMWVSSGSFCFSWDRNSPSEEFTASYWSLL